jgi:hypothetical protein
MKTKPKQIFNFIQSTYEKEKKYAFLGLEVSPSGFVIDKHSLLEFGCFVSDSEGIMIDGFEAIINESDRIDLVYGFDYDNLDEIKLRNETYGKNPELEIIRFAAWLDGVCDLCVRRGITLILLCNQTHYGIQWINTYLQKYTKRMLFGLHPEGMDLTYKDYVDINHVFDPTSIYAGACLALGQVTIHFEERALECLNLPKSTYQWSPSYEKAQKMVSTYIEFRKKCLSGDFLKGLVCEKEGKTITTDNQTNDSKQKNKRKKPNQ